MTRVKATPFPLKPEGPAETAILWKNLILLGRYVSAKTMLRVLPLVIMVGVFAANADRAGGVSSVVAGLCLPFAAMLLLLGPQMMRNDLRQDLAALPMLKTWPVTGAAIVRGEVLAPTLVVTAMIWLLVLLGAMLGGELFSKAGAEAWLSRASIAVAAAIVAPAIVLSQTVVLNGIAVLFPAWSTLGASRARGIDAMGQRLVMLAGILLPLTLSLLPGAIVAGVVVFIVRWLTGTIIVILPALIVAAIVLAECWIATELLGRVLDRTDVSAIDPTE